MLSIGWTEMLIVAAIALIVVGPKDLPAMLRQIGKAVGTARRMGNDFKKELNKVAAIDEIRDIKKSFTEPLNETRSKIESEFNSITPDGKVVPSGVIKPSDPQAESVVDEIRSAAGMGPSLADNAQAAKDSMASAVTRAAQQEEAVSSAVKKSALSKTAVAKTARGKAAANKAKAKNAAAKNAAAKNAAAKSAAAKSAAAKPKAKPKAKSASKSAAKPASAKPETNPAPKPRARRAAPKPAKPVAAKPAPAKPAAQKRSRRKPAQLAAIANAPDDK